MSLDPRLFPILARVGYEDEPCKFCHVGQVLSLDGHYLCQHCKKTWMNEVKSTPSEVDVLLEHLDAAREAISTAQGWADRWRERAIEEKSRRQDLLKNFELECKDVDEILYALGGIPRTEGGRIQVQKVIAEIVRLKMAAIGLPEKRVEYTCTCILSGAVGAGTGHMKVDPECPVHKSWWKLQVGDNQ